MRDLDKYEREELLTLIAQINDAQGYVLLAGLEHYLNKLSNIFPEADDEIDILREGLIDLDNAITDKDIQEAEQERMDDIRQIEQYFHDRGRM